jgi:hypothetical protein
MWVVIASLLFGFMHILNRSILPSGGACGPSLAVCGYIAKPAAFSACDSVRTAAAIASTIGFLHTVRKVAGQGEMEPFSLSRPISLG